MVRDVAAGNAVFNGVRFYLGPTILHTPSDDDSAAVTFWFHEDASYEKGLLIQSLAKALRLLGVNDLASVPDPVLHTN